MSRKITVADPHEFLTGLLSEQDLDEIDEAAAEIGPVQHRKESEVSQVLSLLDEIGKDGEG